MSGETFLQRVASNSLSGQPRHESDAVQDEDDLQSIDSAFSQSQPSSGILARWTDNPIYKRVPRYVLCGVSRPDELSQHLKLLKAWDMTECWKYVSQEKTRTSVKVSYFQLDTELHEPLEEGDLPPHPMDLLVVWPRSFAKRLRRSAEDLLFTGYLLHREHDCIPVLIRRAAPGQRLQKDLLPFIPAQDKTRTAAIVFDPREWVLQYKALTELKVEYRDVPHITAKPDMWRLLSPKALLTKHDYICWDDSNHDVMLLIGRSWIKTVHLGFGRETVSNEGSIGEKGYNESSTQIALQHYIDLSGDLEASVVLTNVGTEKAQKSVSFVSDPGAILVLVAKGGDYIPGDDRPPLSVVMKSVTNQQRVLCQYDKSKWDLVQIPSNACAHVVIQNDLREGLSSPNDTKRLLEELDIMSLFLFVGASTADDGREVQEADTTDVDLLRYGGM